MSVMQDNYFLHYMIFFYSPYGICLQISLLSSKHLIISSASIVLHLSKVTNFSKQYKLKKAEINVNSHQLH